MSDLSVDDLLRLVDGLKAKGINQFRGAGIEFTAGPVRAQPRRKIVPPPEPVKNAVDLALDMNGRSSEDEESE